MENAEKAKLITELSVKYSDFCEYIAGLKIDSGPMQQAMINFDQAFMWAREAIATIGLSMKEKETLN